MTANMDVSLDEILAERKSERRGNRSRNDRNDRNGGRSGRRDRDRRDDYPRDGVRKHHVKASRSRASPERTRGTRVRVDNLHYDLTKDDLEGLFSRIGPVAAVDLVYDRAGRSEGTAYVTYLEHDDARAALREYDGANAKGQPIRLAIVPAGGRRGHNGNVAVGSGRPLAERISRPRKRGGDDGDDQDGQDDEEGDGRTSLSVAARRGIDRYVPGSDSTAGGGGSGRLSRSRSPPPRRRDGGRRPGERRGGRNGNGRSDNNNNNNNNNQNGGGGGGNRRPRKTQEELDAEMADYFVEGSNGAATATAAPAVEAAAAAHDDGDDTDMIL
ncbi:RNA-binding protein [Sporothrix brasiliensis 5110]|uniref:RNA-binding protein n=1 Tax=Sporothrix brasiliensis 5110 TaxID=1398154 RepID=A0A0C2J3Y3_9PEZI|nr:RNA-binding protein [Sporothrix brasiliensis 5110]KIH91787.1 RNA-binding protein [Sporothrix brasiliensis 5110]